MSEGFVEPFNSSAIHPFNIKGGGAKHRMVFIINPPLIPPLPKGVVSKTSLPKGGGTVVSEGFVEQIHPSTLHLFNESIPVGLVNPTYILASFTFLPPF